jgi:ATP-dependent DNA helicase RecG
MELNDPLTKLKGVGESLAAKFSSLGIKSIYDLLNYYPRRYDDYSKITSIAKMKPGLISIQATIKSANGRYVRRGMHVTEAIASDQTGSIRLVWFNQPYREGSIKSHQQYFISGNYELRRGRFSLTNPNIELVSDLPINAGRILAIYKETKGLNSRQIRLVNAKCLELTSQLDEILPDWIIKENKLMDYGEAIKTIHAPTSPKQLDESRRRLGFDEVFSLSLASLMNKQAIKAELAEPVSFDPKLARSFTSHLPFSLTDAQRLTTMRIYKDIEKTDPMNRLVEGDVGSGKTVVATMAALMALSQGWQVALMAPTELLARQHAETIHNLLGPIGYADQVLLLVGSMTGVQKTKARKSIESGHAGFLIGTNALIQEKVNMHKLAMIIIDEQHRFGVEQRKKLMAKAGHMPHVLSLTATPIPRSLALTLYGELDVSILDQKPVGRQTVITELISPNSRKQLYEKIDAEIDKGRQMFVVCPLINDSSVLEANSAEKVYEQLSKHDFKHRRVGLLHGQLKSQTKKDTMQEFVDHKLDILVSTTVIEVGVDVPNASIMMIESAERFGLAQLHQLRGRVGRGFDQAYCYLILSDSKYPTKRLQALTSTSDGFKLAELDLDLRGPGAIYGTLQHGALDLRIAKLSDTRLIAIARLSAQEFISRNENLIQYKQLNQTVNRLRMVTNLN